MESNEAGGELGHMLRLSRNRKEEAEDTFADTCPAPWEVLGV